MTEPLDLKHLQQWVGRTETHGDTITPRLLEAFRAILDHPRGSLDAGETVPPGLHWCLAPHAVAMHDIGPDGHPARGGFLPPVPLPRRMWAGARLKFLRELKVGESVTRVSEVKSVTTKIGRTGPLCFVLVEHRLSNDGGIAVSEEHDIVYRGIDAPAGGSPQRCDAMGEADFERVIEPNPVLLFRYSAVTFNGHRIHYDRSYVTEVEGYPGLIVHGPLQATLLLDVVAKLQPARALKSFAFRATHPLFDPAPFKVKGRMLDEDHAQLWVEGAGGILHMDAKAAWSD